MGLVWNKPKEITVRKGPNQGKTMVITAMFPKTPLIVQQIWNLWNTHKAEVKADGFSLGKWNDNWQISYWHKVNDDSFKKNRNADGTESAMYLADFKRKYKKWRKVYDELPAAKVKMPVKRNAQQHAADVDYDADDGDNDFVEEDDNDLIDSDDLDL